MNKNGMMAATMMYMAAMAEATDIRPQEILREQPARRENKEIIPNGCKKYYFTKSGQHFKDKPNGYEIIFECIAMNDKSACNKFLNFTNLCRKAKK